MNRRKFLTTGAAAGVAAATTGSVLWSSRTAIAQQPGKPQQGSGDPVADHIVHEASRILKEANSKGLKAEHLATMAANTRLLASHWRATGVDTKVRSGLTVAVETQGRARVLDNASHIDHLTDRTALMRRQFPDSTSLDTGIPEAAPVDYDLSNRFLTAMLDGREAGSQRLDELARALDDLRVSRAGRLAAIEEESHKGYHALQAQIGMPGACEDYRQQYEFLDWLSDIVCSLILIGVPSEPECAALMALKSYYRFIVWLIC